MSWQDSLRSTSGRACLTHQKHVLIGLDHYRLQILHLLFHVIEIRLRLLNSAEVDVPAGRVGIEMADLRGLILLMRVIQLLLRLSGVFLVLIVFFLCGSQLSPQQCDFVVGRL